MLRTGICGVWIRVCAFSVLPWRLKRKETLIRLRRRLNINLFIGTVRKYTYIPGSE